MTAFEPLAELTDLPEGGLLAVRNAAGEAICLANVRGEVSALVDCCTHAEFPLSDGVIHADGSVECVWHGARFDCATGAVCKGPAVDGVVAYDVRVEGGKILVGPRRPIGAEAAR
ncbi:MAG: Rieske 2Fe-2S domain-containing protein [Gemmatimonadota bacterium]|nr:Rieske 2Fe-2S domain-containing protein [Gemmatimonadota bacterium]